MICKVCKTEFKKRHGRQTCGKPECAARWRSVRGAARRGRKPFEPRDIPCEICGEIFTQKQTNNTVCQKHTCKLAYKRIQTAKRKEALKNGHGMKPKLVEPAPARPVEPVAVPPQYRRETRSCAHCGVGFSVHPFAADEFCSPWCRDAARDMQPVEAFVAATLCPFATMDTLPPGCVSWYQAEMTPFI